MGVSSGSQVTAAVASTFDKEVTTSFVAPVSSIVLNDVTNIEIGHAVSDESGGNIFVTNIADNEVFFSGNILADKSGNNLNQNFQSVSPVNFGQGYGAKFDIDRTGGAYSATVSTTSFFPSLQPEGYSGTFGNGVSFNVVADHSSGTYTTVVQVAPGVAYSATETVTILGTSLGGASPANDLIITIDTVDASGSVLTFTASGSATATSSNPNVGQVYTAGETLVIYGTQLDGLSPTNDLKINILTVDTGGEILTFNVTGTGISPNQDYSGIVGSGGTGRKFSIKC